MEACSSDNKGTYSAANCKLANLRTIEPTLPATEITVEPNVPANGFTIKATAASKNTFSIEPRGCRCAHLHLHGEQHEPRRLPRIC